MTKNKKHMTAHAVGGNYCVYIDSDFFQFSRKHPEYNTLFQAIEANDADKFIKTYNDFIVRFKESTNEKYEMKEPVKIAETVTYRGKVIDDPVLVKIIKNYGTTCDALKRFLDNLFLNPAWESVKQLGSFLQHGEFALTEDGCFLGYKSVKSNFKDIYTGTIDNSIGTTVTMPRAKVTFNPDIACSAGLHVGTYGYARGYGSDEDKKIVLVKVNPAHCVSVPHDHNSEKLRCSQYTVVSLCDGVLPQGYVYSAAGEQFTFESFFAEVVEEQAYRRRRATVTACPTSDCSRAYDYCNACGDGYCCGECECCDCCCDDCCCDCCHNCDDDDWDDEVTYYCDNCEWTCDEIEKDDIVYNRYDLAFCPACGNEILKT